jgi:hypothetical protein
VKTSGCGDIDWVVAPESAFYGTLRLCPAEAAPALSLRIRQIGSFRPSALIPQARSSEIRQRIHEDTDLGSAALVELTRRRIRH